MATTRHIGPNRGDLADPNAPDRWRHFRVTRPAGYSERTPGHTDLGARQGYYTDAWNVRDAQLRICERDGHTGEAAETDILIGLDVQEWGEASSKPKPHL